MSTMNLVAGLPASTVAVLIAGFLESLFELYAGAAPRLGLHLLALVLHHFWLGGFRGASPFERLHERRLVDPVDDLEDRKLHPAVGFVAVQIGADAELDHRILVRLLAHVLAVLFAQLADGAESAPRRG